MEDLQLFEPIPIEDDLCTGLGLIEDLGYAARFVCYHQQTCYETGQAVLLIKRKIVLPISAIRPAITKTAQFLGRRVAGSRLVRPVP